jgi:hypothetical protein
LIRLGLLVRQTFEEALRTGDELTCFSDIIHAEASLDQM